MQLRLAFNPQSCLGLLRAGKACAAMHSFWPWSRSPSSSFVSGGVTAVFALCKVTEVCWSLVSCVSLNKLPLLSVACFPTS